MRSNTNRPDPPGAVEVDVPAPGGGWLRAERSGTGSPVVLLHGAGMDARLWNAIVPELVRNHDVVRYDARGLGSSSLPDRPFDDVEDLGAVLDHFGLNRAALVGLSMGGETALDFALAYPERVSALALVGASVSGHVWPEDAQSSAYATARRQRDAAALAALELSIWASLGRTAPGAELIEAMVADNAERRVASEPFFAHFPNRDAESRLRDIAAPTLVVHGDHDHPEIAAIAERLVAGIPDACEVVVSNADHYLPLRSPQQLVELLLSHLA
ncbi:alpha/beta fold hydrolase [Rugosimonospora africana]|uniref:3-oxoadipate enol-lactonase n=1 Tax=Rugosimonospora africana TaxID=556532 RepID=A0A8J3VR89_9ACTN|nr:alpha/beta hydrolase [Rugosimonospora africana]GIH15879.1 3-oxoadipate enol-lactonase [Rugosimonospora africana]